MTKNSIKVIIGKVGLDGHDRGVRTVASWLSSAGMEVVYLGTHNTVKSVVATGLQEDADVLGLSFQGGDHVHLLEQTTREMEAHGLKHMLLIAGGNIPRQDSGRLKEIGVDQVFHPGTPMNNIVAFIRENVPERQA